MRVTRKMINRFIYKLEELKDVIYKPNQAESNKVKRKEQELKAN